MTIAVAASTTVAELSGPLSVENSYLKIEMQELTERATRTVITHISYNAEMLGRGLPSVRRASRFYSFEG